MILAEQGADVIKVEPPNGDVIRKVGSGREGMSAYFANLNRGKRSIALDLRSRRGVEVVHRLLGGSDVLVQSFRPGVADKIGLGAAAVRSIAPELVYVSITGFGKLGPLAHEPAYDHVIQALSGMAALQQQTADGKPHLIRHGVIDKTTGATVAQAITSALLMRTKDGAGSEIEISMLDSALHYLWPDGMMNHTCLEPLELLPPVSRGFRLTETVDGFVAMVTVTDDQWAGLVRAVGMEERLFDQDLQGQEARMKNGGKVMRQIAVDLATKSTGDVIEMLRAYGVPCMPVVGLDAVATHEQVVASGCVAELDHPVLGRIVQPRSPIRIFGERGEPPCPAPQLGADGDAILAECGFNPEDIQGLRREAIVF
jgi:crotonobetainyl-CoA:carnitine CoA-transferase CaiB-like acyl-CoA transferase